jgi:hypothetical protein
MRLVCSMAVTRIRPTLWSLMLVSDDCKTESAAVVLMRSPSLFRTSMAFSNSALVGVSISQQGRPRKDQPFTRLMSNDADWFVIMPASQPFFRNHFV